MSQLPRTPRYFPKMKMRGGKKQHLHQVDRSLAFLAQMNAQYGQFITNNTADPISSAEAFRAWQNNEKGTEL